IHLVGAASGVLCGFSVLDESNRKALDFFSFPSISQTTSKQAMPKRASTQPPAPRGTKRLKRTICYVDGFDCSGVSMSDLVATQPNLDQLAEIVNACVMEGDLLWILEPRDIIRLMRTCRYMFCFLASFKAIAFRRWMSKNGLGIISSSLTTDSLTVSNPFEIGLFDYEVKKVLTDLFPKSPPLHENVRWLQTRIQKQETPELRVLARSVAARIKLIRSKSSKDHLPGFTTYNMSQALFTENQELSQGGDIFASLAILHKNIVDSRFATGKATLMEIIRLIEDKGSIIASDMLLRINVDIVKLLPDFHTTYIGADVTGDFYTHALAIKDGKRSYTASDRLRHYYFLQRAATNGDSRALLDLAQMFMGAGIRQRTTPMLAAVTSFDGLDPFVVYRCGMYIMKNEVLKKRVAIRFFESIQHPDLLRQLGVAFSKPRYRDPNPILALYWFKRAVEYGCKESETHIQELQSHPEHFDIANSRKAENCLLNTKCICSESTYDAILRMLNEVPLPLHLRIAKYIRSHGHVPRSEAEYQMWLEIKNSSNLSIEQQQEGLMLLAQATKKDPQKHGAEFEQEYKVAIQTMESEKRTTKPDSMSLFDMGMALYSKPICEHRLAYMMFRMADRLGDPRAHGMVEVCERKWDAVVHDLV
ncbi:uncharacterized protein BJ171DRAFT_500818, partial [Polychytrium aggregatum]|uniref:uncharacterized protein n=1 Tax=Polychytrium aggregatum TaxID=110093 RepID=UPI0022FE7E85